MSRTAANFSSERRRSSIGSERRPSMSVVSERRPSVSARSDAMRVPVTHTGPSTVTWPDNQRVSTVVSPTNPSSAATTPKGRALIPPGDGRRRSLSVVSRQDTARSSSMGSQQPQRGHGSGNASRSVSMLHKPMDASKLATLHVHDYEVAREGFKDLPPPTDPRAEKVLRTRGIQNYARMHGNIERMQSEMQEFLEEQMRRAIEADPRIRMKQTKFKDKNGRPRPPTEEEEKELDRQQELLDELISNIYGARQSSARFMRLFLSEEEKRHVGARTHESFGRDPGDADRTPPRRYNPYRHHVVPEPDMSVTFANSQSSTPLRPGKRGGLTTTPVAANRRGSGQQPKPAFGSSGTTNHGSSLGGRIQRSQSNDPNDSRSNSTQFHIPNANNSQSLINFSDYNHPYGGVGGGEISFNSTGFAGGGDYNDSRNAPFHEMGNDTVSDVTVEDDGSVLGHDEDDDMRLQVPLLVGPSAANTETNMGLEEDAATALTIDDLKTDDTGISKKEKRSKSDKKKRSKSGMDGEDDDDETRTQRSLRDKEERKRKQQEEKDKRRAEKEARKAERDAIRAQREEAKKKKREEERARLEAEEAEALRAEAEHQQRLEEEAALKAEEEHRRKLEEAAAESLSPSFKALNPGQLSVRSGSVQDNETPNFHRLADDESDDNIPIAPILLPSTMRDPKPVAARKVRSKSKTSYGICSRADGTVAVGSRRASIARGDDDDADRSADNFIPVSPTISQLGGGGQAESQSVAAMLLRIFGDDSMASSTAFAKAAEGKKEVNKRHYHHPRGIPSPRARSRSMTTSAATTPRRPELASASIIVGSQTDMRKESHADPMGASNVSSRRGRAVSPHGAANSSSMLDSPAAALSTSHRFDEPVTAFPPHFDEEESPEGGRRRRVRRDRPRSPDQYADESVSNASHTPRRRKSPSVGSSKVGGRSARDAPAEAAVPPKRAGASNKQGSEPSSPSSATRKVMKKIVRRGSASLSTSARPAPLEPLSLSDLRDSTTTPLRCTTPKMADATAEQRREQQRRNSNAGMGVATAGPPMADATMTFPLSANRPEPAGFARTAGFGMNGGTNFSESALDATTNSNGTIVGGMAARSSFGTSEGFHSGSQWMAGSFGGGNSGPNGSVGPKATPRTPRSPVFIAGRAASPGKVVIKKLPMRSGSRASSLGASTSSQRHAVPQPSVTFA